MDFKTALDEQEASQPATAKQSLEIDYPDLNALLAALEHERIAAIAYLYWEQRGCPEGSPNDDWFRAERDIREGAK